MRAHLPSQPLDNVHEPRRPTRDVEKIANFYYEQKQQPARTDGTGDTGGSSPDGPDLKAPAGAADFIFDLILIYPDPDPDPGR